MKARFWLILVPIVSCLLARPAFSETVVEAWRGGGFISPYSVSVNSSDGSCWVAE